MTEFEENPREEVPLFVLAAPLVRNRWRILRWAILGTAVAVALVFQRPALYSASASFYPKGSESSPAGFQNIAGQLGFQLSQGGRTQSPEFYQALLKSRVLLQKIALDTLVLEGRGGERVPFLEFFEIEGGSEKSRIDDAVELLSGIVGTPMPPRNTSLVIVSAATEWPSVSLSIVKRLLEGLNDFNAAAVTGQAGAERVFVERRLELASAELRAAEDSLESFLKSNRQFERSPELMFHRNRLDRNMSLRQGVYTSLTQTLEETRIREVRDLPTISMVEEPAVPSRPGPRGRGIFIVLGLLTGGFLGALVSLSSEAMQRVRSESRHEVDDFFVAWGEMLREVSRPFVWMRGGFRR